MKRTKATLLLRSVAIFALLTLTFGGILGHGRLARSPGNPSDLFAQILGGAGDGFMGLVVLVVLAAPPLAMIIVAVEGRSGRPKHLWIALATMSVLLVSALIAVAGI